MLAKLAPRSDQIRWWAEDALGSFGTLSAEDAAENAKANLSAILRYLDALDRAEEPVLILGIETIKPGGRGKFCIGEAKVGDLPHL